MGGGGRRGVNGLRRGHWGILGAHARANDQTPRHYPALWQAASLTLERNNFAHHEVRLHPQHLLPHPSPCPTARRCGLLHQRAPPTRALKGTVLLAGRRHQPLPRRPGRSRQRLGGRAEGGRPLCPAHPKESWSRPCPSRSCWSRSSARIIRMDRPASAPTTCPAPPPARRHAAPLAGPRPR